jgi:hypothetical protein
MQYVTDYFHVAGMEGEECVLTLFGTVITNQCFFFFFFCQLKVTLQLG